MCDAIPFGVSFDGFVPVREAVDLARRAEASGARSFWIAEHLGYREAFVTATAIALGTASSRLVPTAISPYLRHPMPMAMALASLAELVPGRVAIAAGVGNPMFLRESGLEAERPVEAMHDYVRALRALLAGGPVQQDGRTFRLAGARVAFEPPSPIPIHIAAMGPQMLKLTGRIADGVVLSAGLSTDSTRRALATVEEAARAEARDPAALMKASYIYFLAGGEPAQTRGRVREKLAFLFRNATIRENLVASGLAIDHEAIMAAVARRDVQAAAALVPDEAIDLFTITGDVATCRRRVREYRDAGLTEIVLSLVGTNEDRMQSLEHVPAILAR
jgi:alkanesulfonate monooxygenase SsuD/methylene tetrahydromethanopterin reductase-like flavin-dependent oxidoreductase (luciferase family)